MKALANIGVLGLAVVLSACTTQPTIPLNEKQQALVGRKLRWQMFVSAPESLADQHQHCTFCAVVICEKPLRGQQRDGYTTDDGSQWVCNGCFDRLNPRFRWVTE